MVGIIGAGRMGSAFARRLTEAGHEVQITAKHPRHAEEVARAVGGSARAVPRNEIGRGADLVILATPYSEATDALQASGDLNGALVIDISNPVKADMSALIISGDSSAAEKIQKAMPGARVVKAFNTIFSQILGGDRKDGHCPQVFYAGDDQDAKNEVRHLIEQVGFEPVDSGPLANSRELEQLGLLNLFLGHKAGMGTGVAPAWVQVA